MRVPRGAVTGLVGPNGAGKSTTLRMLLGLVAPSSGEATVLGHPIGAPARYLGRVGALVEAPASWRDLSGRRNLQVLATLGGHDHARIPRVLQEVGLADRADDPARTYSLGMRQRLGIAMALLGDPELLVLDEPVNGLDPAGIHEIRQLLRRLADGGTTVLVSSHLLAEVEQVCDWLVILQQGRCRFQGSLPELLASRGEGLLVGVEDAAGYAVVQRICHEAGYATRREDGKLVVDGPASWAGELNRRAMAAGATLVELAPRRGHLEDVFLQLTGDHQGQGEGVTPA
jgi:ABC-2 type transport system ATP-binding protein